jgi:hypothetical protein
MLGFLAWEHIMDTYKAAVLAKFSPLRPFLNPYRVYFHLLFAIMSTLTEEQRHAVYFQLGPWVCKFPRRGVELK